MTAGREEAKIVEGLAKNAAHTVEEVAAKVAKRIDEAAADVARTVEKAEHDAAGAVPATPVKPQPKNPGTQAPPKTGRDGLPMKVAQTQNRHIRGNPKYGGAGYFIDGKDAQAVLTAFHEGRVTILGRRPNGNLLVRCDDVTGFNHNPGAGYHDQPTHVFMLKGTTSVSVVPIDPNAKP